MYDFFLHAFDMGENPGFVLNHDGDAHAQTSKHNTRKLIKQPVNLSPVCSWQPFI